MRTPNSSGYWWEVVELKPKAYGLKYIIKFEEQLQSLEQQRFYGPTNFVILSVVSFPFI